MTPDITQLYDADDFNRYDIDVQRGFLTGNDPLPAFETDHPFLDRMDELGHNLPDYLDDDRLRPALEELDPPEDTLYDQLSDEETFRLYQVSSFLASAFIHKTGEDVEQKDYIPDGVAQPLYESTERLDIPPILSFDAYSLRNWERDDPDGPLELGNIDTIQNFVNMDDEAWFMLVHTEIEQEAADALTAIPYAQRAAAEDDPETLSIALDQMHTSVSDMVETLKRMPEGNSPDVYGEGFRPYIDGFDGIEYRGVEALDGPQDWRGETGAQSSILPSLDAALEISHDTNVLTQHIDDMRDYMPAGHRSFISDIEDGPSIREYIDEAGDEGLAEQYNSVLEQIFAFREIHLNYAVEYILEKLGDETGTGGTEYIKFLGDLKRETGQSAVDREPEDIMRQAMQHTLQQQQEDHEL